MDSNQVFKSPMIFDGAFGTYYMQLSKSTAPCELAVLNDRQTVEDIHTEYIAAGVDAIKTNTFGTNFALLKSRDSQLLKTHIVAGFGAAQAAVAQSGKKVDIFADIGPVPSAPAEEQQALEEYLLIADAFIDAGAKDFLFETFSAFEPLDKVCAHIKSRLLHSRIIVTFAVRQDGYTAKGNYFKDLLRAATDCAHVDATGLNCVCGPSHLKDLAQGIKLQKPLCVMPNSGYPMAVGERTIFLDNAQYFAEKLWEIYQDGAVIVGGCCGTTPRHIQKSVELFAKNIKSGLRQSPQSQITEKKQLQQQQCFFEDNKKSNHAPQGFSQKLRAGKGVVVVELESPLDADAAYITSAAAALKGCGVDAVTVADSPLSRTRADSIMIAAHIKAATGVEVVPHLTCRDKNIIAIKSALLAGHISGVRNVFVITGDPIVATERNSVKGVYNFHSVSLAEYISSLNRTVFCDSPYTVGAAININAANYGAELKRARAKLAAGVSFFMTQPVFSPSNIQRIQQAQSQLDAPVLAGIMPLAGYKNALFLNNEVSGINIPQEIVQAFKDKTASQSQEVAVSYCKGLIDELKGKSGGFYIMTQRRRVSTAQRVAEYALQNYT